MNNILKSVNNQFLLRKILPRPGNSDLLHSVREQFSQCYYLENMTSA